MKRLTLLPGLLFLMLQAAFSQESGSCKPVNLVCDYLVNPLGIDNPAPRLSWMLNDARKGARQTACQVIVDKDSLELIAGKSQDFKSFFMVFFIKRFQCFILRCESTFTGSIDNQ